jgi:hypothetical protein
MAEHDAMAHCPAPAAPAPDADDLASQLRAIGNDPQADAPTFLRAKLRAAADLIAQQAREIGTVTQQRDAATAELTLRIDALCLAERDLAAATERAERMRSDLRVLLIALGERQMSVPTPIMLRVREFLGDAL